VADHRVVRVLIAAMTAVVLSGCAPHHVITGEPARYVVPTLDSDDAGRYGRYGVSPLSVRAGEPAELTGTLVDGGAPAPAGTPYYVTIGFADGMPRRLDGIDSAGVAHPPLVVLAEGALRPCEVTTSGYAQCRIYVMPPGTELIGLTLADVS
jgi:hypothetical protein